MNAPAEMLVKQLVPLIERKAAKIANLLDGMKISCQQVASTFDNVPCPTLDTFRTEDIYKFMIKFLRLMDNIVFDLKSLNDSELSTKVLKKKHHFDNALIDFSSADEELYFKEHSKSEKKEGTESVFDQTHQIFKCKICQIESASRFYVQIEQPGWNWLDGLRLGLNSEFESLSKYVDVREKDVVCKLNDDLFRAEVKGELISENCLKVFLIDYGRDAVVSRDDVYNMPDNLSYVPVCARLAHLDSISPVAGQWPPEATLLLAALLEAEGPNYQVVTPLDCDPYDCLPVTLYGWDKDISINDLMCDFGFAIKLEDNAKGRAHASTKDVSSKVTLAFEEDNTNGETHASTKDVSSKVTLAFEEDNTNGETHASTKDVSSKVTLAFEEDNTNGETYASTKDVLMEAAFEDFSPLVEESCSEANNPDLDIDDPSVLICGYKPKDKKICASFAETGQCRKKLTCRLEHPEQYDPLRLTYDKEEICIQARQCLEPFHQGQKVRVRVTHIASAVELYCVLAQPQGQGVETLDSLERYINSESNVRSMKRCVVPPCISQLVLARSSQKGTWYRGEVKEVQVDGGVKLLIHYVDHGQCELLSVADVCLMEPRYTHLPFQAIKCILENLELAPEVQPERGLEYLLKLVVAKEWMDMIVVADLTTGWNQTTLLVQLLDASGSDVGAQLLMAGFARRHKHIVPSASSTIRPG